MSNNIVDQIASVLHDEWRAQRLLADGSYEPRIKDDGAGGTVDIANTDYVNLPEKWQAENKAAAWLVAAAIQANPEGTIDDLAAVVHTDWLSRNGEWAPAEQALPYAELSEDEKEKDRAVVRVALSVIG